MPATSIDLMIHCVIITF